MNATPIWKTILSDEGIRLYEGFTLNDKPYGSGTSYFKNGGIYQEGVFGIKGLLCGKEYYPNGQLRFEGAYELCRGYGPNYPVCGKCYNEEGNLYFKGELTVRLSGLGYPMIVAPTEYGSVRQKNIPPVTVLLWQDVSHLGIDK